MGIKEIAASVLQCVGGKDNVVANSLCMTRLRISITDPKRVDRLALSSISGVLGTANRGPNGIEVVFGPKAVRDVFNEFSLLTGLKSSLLSARPVGLNKSLDVHISPQPTLNSDASARAGKLRSPVASHAATPETTQGTSATSSPESATSKQALLDHASLETLIELVRQIEEQQSVVAEHTRSSQTAAQSDSPLSLLKALESDDEDDDLDNLGPDLDELDHGLDHDLNHALDQNLDHEVNQDLEELAHDFDDVEPGFDGENVITTNLYEDESLDEFGLPVVGLRLLVLNGPNINMLGIREPDQYGTDDYAALLDLCKKTAYEQGFIECRCYQSNHEGDLVDKIQDAYQQFDGIVINPGAYTHTSIALLDAVKAVKIPTVEVHISKVSDREDFRQRSYIREACIDTITGKGIRGYALAIEKLAAYLKHK